MEYDEIDFLPYISALFRRWYWIILAMIITAGITIGVLSYAPKSYTATASIVIQIQQTGSQVGMNDAVLNIETIDAASRRQGLVSLAQSEAIEAQIAPELLAQVTPSNYKPGMIIRNQWITVQAEGDLLSIQATASTPQQAKQLADTWAQTYVDYTSRLYTDQHSQVRLASTALLPFEPSGPRILRYALVAAILGALLASAAIILRELIATKFVLQRRRYRSEQRGNYAASSSS